MELDYRNIITLINFFFLALTLLAVYYYARRLKLELNRSNWLKAISDRYKELFNATSEGVVETDLEGRFVIINASGAGLLGYDSPQTLLTSGSRFQDFYIEPAEWKDLIHGILHTDRPVNQIVRMQTFKKGRLWMELSFHPRRGSNNEVVGVEGIFRDVTERLAMQKELQSYSENLKLKIEEKTAELLQLERHKFNLEKLAATGQLVAHLVHELRNPLSSIKIGLTTLQRRAELEVHDSRLVEISLKEVITLERMMNELLVYAKPEAIRFELNAVNRLLEYTLDKLEERLRNEQTEITRDFAEGIPDTLFDMDRMSQVFANLIMNAAQASEKPCRILLQSRYLAEKNRISICVQDFGKGIEAEFLPRIFEPFFSSREGGTGLGLSVVKNLVEAHGGEVEVESKVGKGTAFTIFLQVRG